RYFRIALSSGTNVYSLNQVGYNYVNVSASNGYALVFNPFSGVTLDSAMPSPPDGSEAFLTNQFDVSEAYYYDAGTPGWLDENFFLPAGTTNIPANATFIAAPYQAYQFVLAGIVAPEATQPPVITNQPQSQAVMAGTNVSFSVAASGAQPLSYQ